MKKRSANQPSEERSQSADSGITKSFTPRSASERLADVQRRAYELYLERGKEPGHEMEDWLQAEREVFERDEGEKFG